jgi:4'-phosphopantetheinyl transferase
MINENEVHIWRSSISVPVDELQSLKNILAKDEMVRASRFVFEMDCRRYIVARALLRKILCLYLPIEADEMIFNYNDYGKPFLPEAINIYNINFNLSHSGSIIVYAIAKGREIGIDVERIREMEACDDIIDRYFSFQEKNLFQLISPQLQQRSFFTCWTRKEAYVKALGHGLANSFDQFSVSLNPGESPVLLKGDTVDASRWSIKEVISNSAYVAAVAVKGENLHYRYYDYFHKDLSDRH